MIPPFRSWSSRGLLACCLLAGGGNAVPAQEGGEEFQAVAQRLIGATLRERLDVFAQLVQRQQEWLPAIALRVHGQHREYQLQIERLLSQLADERWLAREEAERELGEIGARARATIEDRREHGATLEERLRCERILKALDARGTTREENELAILRGLVQATLYLKTDPQLRAALRSACDHADFEVVDGSLRALGVHGDQDDVARLHAHVTRSPAPHRIAALHALARLPAAAALPKLRELLLGSALLPAERAGVVRVLHTRPDAAELVTDCAGAADPVVAEAARLQPLAAFAPTPVEVGFADGGKVAGAFEGVLGDCLLLVQSAELPALPRIELPLAQVTSVRTTAEVEAPRPGCRIALRQGSLVHGQLIALDAETVIVQTARFGTQRLPRGAVQGILLDPALDRILGGQGQGDRVRLKSGTQIEQPIAVVADQRLQVGEQHLALTDVASLSFGRAQNQVPDTTAWTRVETHDGDRLLGHLGRAEAGGVGLHVPLLGATSIPLGEVKRIEFGIGGGAQWGFTLIADYSDNLVIEVDEQGNEVFRLEDTFGAWDAEALDNGHILIVEFAASRVLEVDRDGKTVWFYDDGLRNPTDADRLQNGNTLIADAYRQRVIEVTPDKQIVWQFAEGVRPYDVERLQSGNTLIADILKDRVIEVDPQGRVVWEVTSMPHVHDADRLPNGNTLITLRTLRKVVEVDRGGRVVWQLEHLDSPSDADRLPNGNTLVSEHGAVREYDRAGKVIWTRAAQWALEANRY